MMEFTNAVADSGSVLGKPEAQIFVQLLAPFAPHVSEELWSVLGGVSYDAWTVSQSVHTSLWPKSDATKVQKQDATIVIQVNGKVRDTMTIPHDVSTHQSRVEEAAKSRDKIIPYITGVTIRKVVFIPAKIINFVVG